jgi:hypothetical protein
LSLRQPVDYEREMARFDWRLDDDVKQELQAAAAAEGVTVKTYLLSLRYDYQQWKDRQAIRAKMTPQTAQDLYTRA